MRRPEDRLIVVAMSALHTYAQRNAQPVPYQRRQASADALAAAAKGSRFSLRPLCVSDRELTYFTDVDHVGHEALAVIDREDSSIVGVARYVTWPERAGAADVAIEVADDLQGNGVGLMLAEALIRRARENGINVLTATTLWENRAARALARQVGFRARSSAGNDIELELHLDSARTGVAEEARGTRRR